MNERESDDQRRKREIQKAKSMKSPLAAISIEFDCSRSDGRPDGQISEMVRCVVGTWVLAVADDMQLRVGVEKL